MKRWHIAVGLIVLGVFGAGVSVIRFFMPYSLESELASARAQGIPTSLKEMHLPPIPPEQDAAPYYEKAWAIQKKNDFSEHEYELLDKLKARMPVNPAEVAQVRRAFKAHAHYLAAINAATSRPHWSPIASGGRIQDSIHLFARSREAAKTLRYESTVLMLERRPMEAARTMSLGYNVGRHLYEQPTVIALLVGFAIDAITEMGLEETLLGTPPNRNVARLVRNAAGRDLEIPDLHKAMLGEVASSIESLASADREAPHASEEASTKDRVLNRSKMAAEIHWQIRAIRAAEAPEPLRRAALQQVADELARSRPRSPAFELALQSVDMWPKMEDTCLRRAAQRRTLYAAACVLEFRARTGRYPDRLDEAVNPVPLDPYDMKPLAYKRTATGFQVKPNAASAKWAAMTDPKRRNVMVFAYPRP